MTGAMHTRICETDTTKSLSNNKTVRNTSFFSTKTICNVAAAVMVSFHELFLVLVSYTVTAFVETGEAVMFGRREGVLVKATKCLCFVVKAKTFLKTTHKQDLLCEQEEDEFRNKGTQKTYNEPFSVDFCKFQGCKMFFSVGSPHNTYRVFAVFSKFNIGKSSPWWVYRKHTRRSTTLEEVFFAGCVQYRDKVR